VKEAPGGAEARLVRPGRGAALAVPPRPLLEPRARPRHGIAREHGVRRPQAAARPAPQDGGGHRALPSVRGARGVPALPREADQRQVGARGARAGRGRGPRIGRRRGGGEAPCRALPRQPAGPPQRLLVTSARLREGKTCVASNLALASPGPAGASSSSIATFRRPRLHRIFRQDVRQGATNFLTGAADLPSLLPQDRLRHRYPARGHAARRARRPDRLELRWQRCSTSCPGVTDYVVIDAPPVLARPMRPCSPALAGGVVLGRPRRRDARGGRGRRVRPAPDSARPGPRRRAQRRPGGAAIGATARPPLPMLPRRAMKRARTWLASGVLSLALAAPAAAEPEALQPAQPALQPMAPGTRARTRGARLQFRRPEVGPAPRHCLHEQPGRAARHPEQPGAGEGPAARGCTPAGCSSTPPPVVSGSSTSPATTFTGRPAPRTFDETLGVWRLPPGTYLILPMLGAFCTRGPRRLGVDGVTEPAQLGTRPSGRRHRGRLPRPLDESLAQGMPSPRAPEGEWEAYPSRASPSTPTRPVASCSSRTKRARRG